jgi:hypothetical protein
MKNLCLAGIIIFVVLMSIGCQPTTPTPILTRTPIKLATQKPHIRGQIINIYMSDGKITGVLIEGNREADTVYDKAIVGINRETQIYINLDGNITDTDPSTLKKGQIVEALFSGPIQTSDPVQASAIEIVILK